MVKFFAKPSDKKSVSPFFISSRNFLQLYKTLLAFLVFMNFIKSASGKTCFEIGWNDYTLDCINNEKEIMAALKSECDAYQTSGDDCVNYFVETLNFCHGVFGGSACTLDYHSYDVLDPCASRVVGDLCNDGFGTAEDYTALVGIIVGGLLTVCCLTAIVRTYYYKTPATEVQPELGDQNAQESNPITPNGNTYGTINDNTEENGGRVAGELAGLVVEVGLRAAVELPLAALSHCNVM